MKLGTALVAGGLGVVALIVLGPGSAAGAADDLPAFPGAEGFGTTTPGGRGGRVLLVTNLNDSGPGSLREAVEAEGPRIVVFRTGGLIELESTLAIRNPYITIAGQTAPGGGICLKNYPLFVRGTHDVIVRHLRCRPGDPMKKEMDSLSVHECHDVIIDHCSASWSIDETLSVTRSQDVTVQWCIISESLHDSYHKKGPHGMGSLISYNGEGGITFHHNIYAHHNARSPRPGGLEGMPGFLLDFRSNLVYNWGGVAGYNGKLPMKMNYIGNYLKPGPSTRESGRQVAFSVGSALTRIFPAYDFMEGFALANVDNWLMFRFPEGVSREHVDAGAPFSAPEITWHLPQLLPDALYEQAGATLPARDAVDARIIEEIQTGTGSIINSQDEVGGWPEYEVGEAPADTDEDGMPDEWETDHNLDPAGPADSNADADGDGYTNTEEYLNATDPLVAETQ